MIAPNMKLSVMLGAIIIYLHLILCTYSQASYGFLCLILIISLFGESKQLLDAVLITV